MLVRESLLARTFSGILPESEIAAENKCDIYHTRRGFRKNDLQR